MFLEYTKKKLINKKYSRVFASEKIKDIISISGAGGKTSTIKIIS